MIWDEDNFQASLWFDEKRWTGKTPTLSLNKPLCPKILGDRGVSFAVCGSGRNKKNTVLAVEAHIVRYGGRGREGTSG